jgi:HAD superfamily hydrolase (TIGR01450 family)
VPQVSGRAPASARAPWPPPAGGTWVIDLDGVIWLTGHPIAGVEEAVAALRGAGVRTLFATNNSSPTRAELHRRMANCGLTTSDADLLSSADVAAGLLRPGTTAFVLADDGVREALRARGVTLVEAGQGADAVVVGWTRDFDFDRVAAAADAVRAGARLIGTNEDPTLPTPAGPLPGAGALLAAVAAASGATPAIAGKPYPPTARAIGARADDLRVVVGDRPSTDGVLADQLGVPFALVLSGVTGPDQVPDDPAPAVTARDLATLVHLTLHT